MSLDVKIVDLEPLDIKEHEQYRPGCRSFDIERLEIERTSASPGRVCDMRHGRIDATAWELEAARRREVVEADFGGSRGTRADDASPVSAANRVRRVAGWFGAVIRPDQVASTARVDRTTGCQPGVSAVKTGS
jgi:hypothetical protein